MKHILAIDVGGIFTDLVLADQRDGSRAITKTLTTPADPAEAFRLGTVESVHPPDELIGEARRIGDTIAEKYAPAVRLAQVRLNTKEPILLMEAYAHECTLTAMLREDPDAQAVAERFLTSRKKR